jgi:hypothetical protein
MRNNQTDIILDANGLHSPSALKKAHGILMNHGYKKPILLHFVLSGSESAQVYRDTYDEIAGHFRSHGFPVEYFGALEMATDKGGLLAHIFFIVETFERFPWNTLNVNDGEFLHKLANKRRINRIHISTPKNRIHRPNPWNPVFFARPEAQDGKLEDCMQWITDEYKNRSDADLPGQEIYFYSEIKANTAKRAAKKKPAPVSVPASSAVAKSLPLSDSVSEPETGSVNLVFPLPSGRPHLRSYPGRPVVKAHTPARSQSTTAK